MWLLQAVYGPSADGQRRPTVALNDHGGPDITSVGTTVRPEQQRPSGEEATRAGGPALTAARTDKEELVLRGTPAWPPTRHPR